MKETDSKHQDDDSFFEQALAVAKQIPYSSPEGVKVKNSKLVRFEELFWDPVELIRDL
jgi:hypothetical protein